MILFTFVIVAAGLLVRAVLLGRLMRTVSAFAVLVPGSLLYLYRASAIPDHVWVTRRFLVSALPTTVSFLSAAPRVTDWGICLVSSSKLWFIGLACLFISCQR